MTAIAADLCSCFSSSLELTGLFIPSRVKMDVLEEKRILNFKFAVEVNSNISAANIFIACDNNDGELNSMKIKLHKDFMTVLINKGETVVHKLKITATPDFFIPVSFYSDSSSLSTLDEVQSGVVIADYINGNLNTTSSGELSASFRVQINSSVLESLISTLGVKGKSVDEPQVGVPYTLHCIMCKAELTDHPMSFSKVAQVLGGPSELSETFFCRRPDVELSASSQKTEELLYTLNYYILNCLFNDRLYKESNTRNVHCKKCSSLLGMKRAGSAADVVHCFKDKIVFCSSNVDMSVWPTINDASLSLLLNIINKTLATSITCKLVLEVKVSPSSAKCLLLWVMSQNVKLFKLEQSTASLDFTEKMELEPVVKVLYQEAMRNSEAARTWMHQFTVDHYYISDLMMQEISSLLRHSTVRMAQFEEMASPFSVGYLPWRM